MKRFLTIQEHNADRAGLHWDLRISYEEGPSKQMSWVIPKHHFPDEDQKLLAINVEDHPWSYRKFEGTLEKGYGKGTVKLLFADWVEISSFNEKKVTYEVDGKKFVIAKGMHGKWFWFSPAPKFVWKRKNA